MINFLKVKNHKGINEVTLNDLGHINVLCGKNNSGKTSILESVNSDKHVVFGKQIKQTDQEWLEEIFRPTAESLAKPHKSLTMPWFGDSIRKMIMKNTVWFLDEKDEIIKEFQIYLDENEYIKNNVEIFKLDNLIDKYFENIIKNHKQILINPKRNLESGVKIDFNQDIKPDGYGLLNRLFFLKNQDIKSDDHKTYQNILTAFEKITGHNLEITPDRHNNITLYFKLKDGANWITSDACGLGLSDTLIMITFSLDFEYNLIMIEEPENHLNPEIQKRFLSFIKKIKSRQFIMSTHSSIFLDPFIVDKIIYTEFDEYIKVKDETSKSEILYSLGYSVADNIVSDVIVLTEGPTDIPVLSTICNWMEFGENYNLKFWPLGGDIMQHLDLSVFAEMKKVIALVDSDPGSSVSRTRFIEKCRELGIKCHKLERYSIENYFTLEALQKVFPELSEIKVLNPDLKVDVQLGFGEDKSIKRRNRKIIEQMKIEDILETDLYKFCLEIRSICESK